MKRPLLIWLISVILLTMCLLISGCITKRGTSLNTGNLHKGEDGIWRLKPASPALSPIEPKKLSTPKSRPVERTLTPVRSRPVAPKGSFAKANPTTITTPPTELQPFQPTISSSPHFNNVIRLPEENNVDNHPQESNIEEETVVVNWTELGMFYLIIILLGIGCWIGWKTWLEWQKADRLKLAAKRQAELDKKKKPAKKKPAKKKTIKKKKLDTKNQRKSTQAARKKPKSS